MKQFERDCTNRFEKIKSLKSPGRRIYRLNAYWFFWALQLEIRREHWTPQAALMKFKTYKDAVCYLTTQGEATTGELPMQLHAQLKQARIRHRG